MYDLQWSHIGDTWASPPSRFRTKQNIGFWQHFLVVGLEIFKIFDSIKKYSF